MRDIDAMIAKKMFEALCLKLNPNSKVEGYIRELHADPFGYILQSEIQVSFISIDYVVLACKWIRLIIYIH